MCGAIEIPQIFTKHLFSFFLFMMRFFPIKFIDFTEMLSYFIEWNAMIFSHNNKQ